MTEQTETRKLDRVKRIAGGRFFANNETGNSNIEQVAEVDSYGIVENGKHLRFAGTGTFGDIDTGGQAIFGVKNYGVYLQFADTGENRIFYILPNNIKEIVGKSQIWIGYQNENSDTNQEFFEEGYFNIEDSFFQGNIKPFTNNSFDIGASANRFQNAYFNNLYYSGVLSNSHQVENPSKLPVLDKSVQKGSCLVITKYGVKKSNKINSDKFVGVFESKEKAVATSGVYFGRIKGKVKKGDRLVTSKNGYLQKARFWQKNSVAFALESAKNKLIKIFIK